jgi:hypothetical protein
MTSGVRARRFPHSSWYGLRRLGSRAATVEDLANVFERKADDD